MIPTTLIDNSRISIGLDKFAEGTRTLEAAMLLRDAPHLPNEPERRARLALRILRSALNWLEDTAHFEEVHAALDEAGKRVRLAFGCTVTFDWKRGYARTCPVDLAHNRIGMSPAIVIEESECSVCGKDPEDCKHITGQDYEGEYCVCHITKARILEISLVSRPSQPDARIEYCSISYDDLREALGPSFEYGMDVSCDKCLLPCKGVTETDLDSVEPSRISKELSV